MSYETFDDGVAIAAAIADHFDSYVANKIREEVKAHKRRTEMAVKVDPRARSESVQDRLRAVADTMKRWRDNPSAAYDDAADRFYAATGMMAPGKSQPFEMCGIRSDEERRKAFDEWSEMWHRQRETAIRESADLLDKHERSLLAISRLKCSGSNTGQDQCGCGPCVALRAICP